jgi:hypothetical protein
VELDDGNIDIIRLCVEKQNHTSKRRPSVVAREGRKPKSI